MSTAKGVKLDEGKIIAGTLLDFNKALLAVAEVSNYGASKYTRSGWTSVENGEERYVDAMMRHLLADTKQDSESGLLHASHVAWNALAVLQIMLDEEINS